MKKHTLAKVIALVFLAAVLLAGGSLWPQTAAARGDDYAAPGRLLGAGQTAGDGSDSSLAGPPGALDTGRYTSGLRSNNGKANGLAHGDGFSLNLVKPETHGHDDDIGARAGWSWEF